MIFNTAATCTNVVC